MIKTIKYLLITLATWISMPSLATDSYDGGTIFISPGETKTISNSGGMYQYSHHNGFDWSWEVWPAGSWSGSIVSGINIVSNSINECTIKANSNLKNQDMELTFKFHYWVYSQYTDMNKYEYNFSYLIKYKEPDKIMVTGITLDKTSASMKVNDNIQLTATVSPSNAADKSVSWYSSDNSIATVSGGLVKAVAEGRTTITCKANDGSDVKATCDVTISSSPVVIAEINSTNFPDANFRNYLLEQEYGKDGALTDEEINARSYMDVSSKEITSLVGIEYFTVLKDLRCNGNHLTTLDVSKNTALETLQCYNNKLSSLDISKNTKLDYLDCHGNNLSALDVSNSPKMRVIVLNENSISGTAMDNLISSLPDKVGLFRVILPSSPYEENICTKVQVAAAKTKGWSVQYRPSRTLNNWEEYEGTNLATVNDVAINAANFPDGCFRSKLLGQDYGKDGILTKEEIEGIVEMNIASMINGVILAGESIKSLKGIEFFAALESLNCSSQKLISLDVSKNIALKSLSCYNNQLTSLNISGNTALQALWCNDNQLSTLDVTHNTALVIFHCYGNQLSGLDMSHNERIHYFNCANNRIKDLSMDLLISSLRTITGDKYEFYILNENAEGGEGNVCTKRQTKALKAKGWIPQYYNGAEWVEYEGSDDTSIATKISLPVSQTVNVGSTLQLTPTIEPATAEATLTWTTDDASIAKVTSTGVVFGIKEGTAIITVTTDNGLKAECFVMVQLPSGISSVGADSEDTPVYTLSGQRLAAPRKGLNIVGGKKMIVK